MLLFSTPIKRMKGFYFIHWIFQQELHYLIFLGHKHVNSSEIPAHITIITQGK